MRVPCCLFLITILLHLQQVEARHTKGNKHHGNSSEKFTSHLHLGNITLKGHKVPSVTNSASSIGKSNVLNGTKEVAAVLEQEDEDTSASGERLIETGNPELEIASSGKDPVIDPIRLHKQKVNQEYASNIKLYHSGKTQDNLNTSVSKKHSITHAEQVRAQTDNTGLSRNADKDLSKSSKSHGEEKVTKKEKARSNVYKKYNLALLGAVPAQAVGYVPLAGAMQTASYLPVAAGLNNIGTPTSGGLLSQFPFSNQLSTGGSLSPQLSSSSVPRFQSYQSQPQPSLASYVAGSVNSRGEQTENLPSEQQQSIVDQLGNTEQQAPQKIIQQDGGQEIQGQQTIQQVGGQESQEQQTIQQVAGQDTQEPQAGAVKVSMKLNQLSRVQSIQKTL